MIFQKLISYLFCCRNIENTDQTAPTANQFDWVSTHAIPITVILGYIPWVNRPFACNNIPSYIVLVEEYGAILQAIKFSIVILDSDILRTFLPAQPHPHVLSTTSLLSLNCNKPLVTRFHLIKHVSPSRKQILMVQASSSSSQEQYCSTSLEFPIAVFNVCQL